MIKYIHRLPFLRFVLPLIVGIVSGDFLFQIGANHLSVFFLLAFLFSSLLLLLLHHVVKQYQHRWVCGSLVFVAIFSAGGYSITSRLDQASYTFPGEQSSYLVTLTGAPEVKERSVLLPITVCYQLDSVAQYPIGRKAYLYLQKDTCSISLKSSDQLLVNSLFSAPNNRNGLDE